MKDIVIEEINVKIKDIKLPRWEELPDFGLYLDQVLLFITKCLSNYYSEGEKILTSSMINNYVKMGAFPAPTRKKYYRMQLAPLMIICVLKPVVAIGDISDYLKIVFEEQGYDVIYNKFCDIFESTNKLAATEAISILNIATTDEEARGDLVSSAFRACAERSVMKVMLRNYVYPTTHSETKS